MRMAAGVEKETHAALSASRYPTAAAAMWPAAAIHPFTARVAGKRRNSSNRTAGPAGNHCCMLLQQSAAHSLEEQALVSVSS